MGLSLKQVTLASLRSEALKKWILITVQYLKAYQNAQYGIISGIPSGASWWLPEPYWGKVLLLFLSEAEKEPRRGKTWSQSLWSGWSGAI